MHEANTQITSIYILTCVFKIDTLPANSASIIPMQLSRIYWMRSSTLSFHSVIKLKKKLDSFSRWLNRTCRLTILHWFFCFIIAASAFASTRELSPFSSFYAFIFCVKLIHNIYDTFKPYIWIHCVNSREIFISDIVGSSQVEGVSTILGFTSLPSPSSILSQSQNIRCCATILNIQSYVFPCEWRKELRFQW